MECGATPHSRQAADDAGITSVQEPTATRMQLSKCGKD